MSAYLHGWKSAPEVVGAMVQVGHHAIVDGQEGEVARARRLHDAEDVQRAGAALADGERRGLGRPEAAVGREGVPAAAGDQAKGGLYTLAPVISVEIPLWSTPDFTECGAFTCWKSAQVYR